MGSSRRRAVSSADQNSGDMGHARDLERHDFDTRDSSNESEYEEDSASWSKENQGSDEPMLAKSSPARRIRSLHLYRVPNRIVRWLCLALMATIMIFIFSLIRAGFTSSKHVQTWAEKNPPPPPQWESFEFLARYYGGIRTLVSKQDYVPEYPKDPEVHSTMGSLTPTETSSTTSTYSTHAIPSSTPYSPYPKYNSPKYKDEYGSMRECFLDAANKIKVPFIHAYKGRPQGLPQPIMGSYEVVGLDDDTCFERYGRLGPYGFGYSLKKGGIGAGLDGEREGAETMWAGIQEVDFGLVQWGEAQKACASKNQHRFQSAPGDSHDPFKEMLLGRSETLTEKDEQPAALNTTAGSKEPVKAMQGSSESLPTLASVATTQEATKSAEDISHVQTVGSTRTASLPLETIASTETTKETQGRPEDLAPAVASKSADAPPEDFAPVKATKAANESPKESNAINDSKVANERPEDFALVKATKSANEPPQDFAAIKATKATNEPPKETAPIKGNKEANERPEDFAPINKAEPVVVRKKIPRTAIVVRTWWDYAYSQDDILYLRSLVAELSLHSGGEYTIHFLIHVKDDNAPIWSDPETYEKALNDALPREFRGMATLWSERQMGLVYGGLEETMYRDLPVHGVYRSAFMPLQYFAHKHPEYEFFWNWEMDIRYTGHWYHFLDTIRQWTKAQPRKGLWERNGRFYIPEIHGSWEDFKQMVRVQSEMAPEPAKKPLSSLRASKNPNAPPQPPPSLPQKPIWGPLPHPDTLSYPTDPKPPTTPEKDKYSWGVAEEADLITFNPMFDPENTDWILAEDVTGYNTSKAMPPRRTAIVTASRLSHRLLETMHKETALQRHSMFSEMWPASCALHHGLKAVFVPHPVFIDRNWPPKYLASIMNAGKNGAVGGSKLTVFGDPRQHNLRGVSWHYNSGFAPNLWRRWLGYRVDNEGGEEVEIAAEGRMCLPGVLLHPIKGVELVVEGGTPEVLVEVGAEESVPEEEKGWKKGKLKIVD